jgi:predicted small metal-binding protein
MRRQTEVGVKSFECAHGGVPCKAKVTGASEEEVLAKAVEHAKKAHGIDLTVSSTLARYAKSLIRDEGASRA